MYYGERFNSITHLVGAALSIAGAACLITLASIHGDVWQIVSVSVYGAVLILLYTASTLYHSFRGRAKMVFQRLDHLAIYLLIAGSYTPFALITLRETTGWWLFGINWGLAAIGIIYEFTLSHKSRIPSLILYVVMGWMAVFSMNTLIQELPTVALFLLSLGGVLYTGGIAFYLFDEKIKYFHGIWHLFVLGGSLAHYFCIALYLI